MDMPPTMVVVADPDSLRWKHYEEALARASSRWPLRLLPWKDVVHQHGDITDQLPTEPSVLRIESPGRSPELGFGLMRLGQIRAGITPDLWSPRHGWVGSPFWLYRGLCEALQQIRSSVESNGRCWASSDLADTALLFDKNAVSDRLRRAGIPTPDSFAVINDGDTFQTIRDRGWESAFAKLAYGSCASGIVVLNVNRDRHRSINGLSTLVQVEDRFCNTRSIKRKSEPSLRPVIEFLEKQHATVQRAVNKTQLHGNPFDVRVIVIEDRVVATVFRASHLPMTNLHLGGYRADPVACRQMIPDRAWADGMEACRRTAQLFGLAAVGIDLAFDARSFQPYVIEANSFGDFFPNWIDSAGRTVHDIEIAATRRRYAYQHSLSHAPIV